jgi:hypothetical protein
MVPPARMTARALDAIDEKAWVGERRRYASLMSGGVAASFS